MLNLMARRGQTRPDDWIPIGRAGQPGYDSHNITTRIRQPEGDKKQTDNIENQTIQLRQDR
jgi:hypothetical protein